MRRTLLFACVGHFLIDFMLGIWPIFKTIAHLDLAIAGLIAASCIVIGEAAQFVFAPLADRGYQRLLLILGLLLTAASAFYSYFSSAAFYFALYFLTCIGSAAFHPTAAALLGQLDIRKKSTVIGIFAAVGMLGFGISQFCFAWTYINLYERTAYLALPAILFSLTIFLYFKKPFPATHEIAPQEKKKSNLELFLYYLRQPTIRALYFLLVAFQTVLWSTVFLLPDFLVSRNYPEWIAFGGGHFFFMLGATVLPPLVGCIADRIPIRKVIVFAISIAVVGLYALLFPGDRFESVALFLLFVVGSQLVSVSALAWAVGSKIGTKNPTVVNALLMGGVWVVSESIGMGISGCIADMFEVEGPAIAIACMGLALFAAIVFALKIPETGVDSIPEIVRNER